MTEAPPINNGFATVLADVREGETLNELSAAILALTQRVRQTGKAGTLTLTLKVTPTSRGAGNSLMISDKITSKLPEFERENTIFFADDDNKLSRRDPRQKELELRSLPSREAAPREASPREIPAPREIPQAVNE